MFMVLATCRDCGGQFHRGADEKWKTLCLACFKQSKKQESDEKILRESEAELWRAKYYEETGRTFNLRQQLAALSLQLASRQEEKPLYAELREMLPRLRQLCHPDRHDGSQAANKATQWLNDVRGRLN